MTTATALTLVWSATDREYLLASTDVNMSFLDRASAARSFRPGTVLNFVGGPAEPVDVHGSTLADATDRARRAYTAAADRVHGCLSGDACDGLAELADALTQIHALPDCDPAGEFDCTWTTRADLATEATFAASDAACHA